MLDIQYEWTLHYTTYKNSRLEKKKGQNQSNHIQNIFTNFAEDSVTFNGSSKIKIIIIIITVHSAQSLIILNLFTTTLNAFFKSIPSTTFLITGVNVLLMCKYILENMLACLSGNISSPSGSSSYSASVTTSLSMDV